MPTTLGANSLFHGLFGLFGAILYRILTFCRSASCISYCLPHSSLRKHIYLPIALGDYSLIKVTRPDSETSDVAMDFIRKYDIELDKEQYYAGEVLRGRVVIENAENLRITGVQVYLRGKAHVEWRITRGGERRTVKEDQYFIDEKAVVWGKAAEAGDDASISILERGEHRMPFEFDLPNDCIPCSFESRIGTIRYYLRVIIDIPYASPPQGLKYFTVIGQQIDCLDDRYMVPMPASRQLSSRCALCSCTSGPLSLDACLERTAYCCNEPIGLKCDVTNGTDQDVVLTCRLVQNVEYRINKGPLGLNKDVQHFVVEYKSQPISAHSNKNFHELHKDLRVPVMPPTLTNVCRLIEIFYELKVNVHMEKTGEDLQLEFPFVVATVPYRDRTTQHIGLSYEPADEHVEGGIYISPEFQLGQVYDGATDVMEDVILYRPVYVCAPHQQQQQQQRDTDLGNGHSPSVKGDIACNTPSPAQSRQAAAAPAEYANGHSPVNKTKKLKAGGGGDRGLQDAGSLQKQTALTNHEPPPLPPPESRDNTTSSSHVQSPSILQCSVNSDASTATVAFTATTSSIRTSTETTAVTASATPSTLTTTSATSKASSDTIATSSKTSVTTVACDSTTSSSTITNTTLTTTSLTSSTIATDSTETTTTTANTATSTTSTTAATATTSTNKMSNDAIDGGLPSSC